MENGDARLQIFPPSFFLSFFDITCVLAVFDNFKKKKGKKRGGGGGGGRTRVQLCPMRTLCSVRVQCGHNKQNAMSILSSLYAKEQ